GRHGVHHSGSPGEEPARGRREKAVRYGATAKVLCAQRRGARGITPILGKVGVHCVEDQRAKRGAAMSGLLEFFNEYFNFKHIAREKREFRQQQARVQALPEDYRYVYRQIQQYMWGYSRGSGMDMLPIFADLLDLFETGAAEGKRVLDVTGEDVATFCDELLRNANAHAGNRREALNRDILRQLGKGNGA